ncbi:MAG: cytidine deaminase, partial [Treponema sp.]|nr:cytidine deaminase [Treponema sp.]
MSLTMEELFTEARQAAFAAYAPYSKFRVGAALLSVDGRVFTGCNVENRSFGLTICAERNAVTHAVSKGCRSFSAIAIAAPDSPVPVPPCGACRQVLSEFMPPDAR